MKFQMTNKGRTLFLEPTEKVCCACGAKESKGYWFYYDEPLSKGLYCRHCAIYHPVFIRNDNEIKYQFWAIDQFRYGGDDDDKTITEV